MTAVPAAGALKHRAPKGAHVRCVQNQFAHIRHRATCAVSCFPHRHCLSRQHRSPAGQPVRGLWARSRDRPRLTHGADASPYCFSNLPKSLLFLFLLPGQGGGHLLVGQLPQPLIAPLVSANSPTSPLCSKNDFSESQCSSSHDSPASSFRRFLLISSLSCLVYLGRSGAAFQT